MQISTQRNLANMISEGEAARIIGVSRSVLRSWRIMGEGPAHVMTPTGRAKYTRDDIDVFVRGLRVERKVDV